MKKEGFVLVYTDTDSVWFAGDGGKYKRSAIPKLTDGTLILQDEKAVPTGHQTIILR